jgi:hypothetical protein
LPYQLASPVWNGGGSGFAISGLGGAGGAGVFVDAWYATGSFAGCIGGSQQL